MIFFLSMLSLIFVWSREYEGDIFGFSLFVGLYLCQWGIDTTIYNAQCSSHLYQDLFRFCRAWVLSWIETSNHLQSEAKWTNRRHCNQKNVHSPRTFNADYSESDWKLLLGIVSKVLHNTCNVCITSVSSFYRANFRGSRKAIRGNGVVRDFIPKSMKVDVCGRHL